MIEFRDPKKKLWLKAIACFLVVTFIWYDIAWAGDLFYTFGNPPAAGVHNLPHPKSDPSKVTNYDVLDYKRKESVTSKLLPANRDREQTGSFAPGYVQEQQAKHEDVIKQKQDAEDLSWALRNSPERKDEAVELKKKKSGSGGGKRAKYTLGDADDINNATTISIPTNPSTWSTVLTYDITLQNIDKYTVGTTKKTDEDGELYWIGTKNVGDPDTATLVMKVVYNGTGKNKTIKAVYYGYALTGNGEYVAKYRVDYTYSGSNITETKTYDTSSGSDVLVSKSTYEGSGDNNHIKTTVYYANDGIAIKKRMDYKYTDNVLKETLLYESNSETEGAGTLKQKTVFTGSKGKEIADYTQKYKTDAKTGESYVASTTVYYYKNGGRSSDSEENYRYAVSKQVTYEGDPDTNKDGVISESELKNAQKESMLVYSDTLPDGSARLAGKEVADYMVTYGEGDTIVSTTVYFYKDGKRAASANYRECMTSSATYYGNPDGNNDGEISAEELAAGIKSSETFYDTLYRLKGEEVADHTVTYASDGVKVTSVTFYTYEGEKDASHAGSDDRMSRTTTYWGNVKKDEKGDIVQVDSEGNYILDGDSRHVAGVIKSVTVYQFSLTAEKGEELADVTINRNKKGEITETVVYYYGDNKRASKAAINDGLTRSVTFFGDAVEAISLLSPDGATYDIDAVIEYMSAKLGIDADGKTAIQLKELLLAAAAGGDASFVTVLSALLNSVSSGALSLAQIKDMESMISVLLGLFGGDNNLLLTLASLDLDSFATTEELVLAILALNGMSAEEAVFSYLILSMASSGYSSIGNFIDELITVMSTHGLAEKLLYAFAAAAMGKEGSLSELITALKAMTSDEKLLALLDGTYSSLDELLSAANAAGLEDEMLALLTSFLKNSGYSIGELKAALLKAIAGSDAALKNVLMMLLSVDISSFTSASELLYALMMYAGGEGLEKLKDLLAARTDLSEYTSSITLMNDIMKEALSGFLEGLKTLTGGAGDLYDFLTGINIDTLFSEGIDTIAELVAYLEKDGGELEGGKLAELLDGISDEEDAISSMADLLEQLKSLVAAGIITDADLLGSDGTTGAFTDLAAGNPHTLFNLLFTKVKAADSETFEAILKVVVSGNTDLLNLLIAADLSSLSSSSTAEDLMILLMNVDTDSDTYPDIIEILMETKPDDASSYPASLVYKYTVKDDAKIKSQTFYALDREGDGTVKSIADYTLNYGSDGVTVKNTTYYYYQNGAGGTRASFADSDQKRARSVTYKGDARSTAVDYDGDSWGDIEEEAAGTDPYDALKYPSSGEPDSAHSDDIAEGGSGNIAADGIKDIAVRQSETFYSFLAGTIQGNEVANYTYNYTSNGTAVKTVTVYKYAELNVADSVAAETGVALMASELDAIEIGASRMVASESYKCDSYDGIKKEPITIYDDFGSATTLSANLQSVTYYVGDKGEEIADCTYNYAADGTTLKSKSVFEYGVITTGSIENGAQNDGSTITYANATQSNDAVMVRSVTYSMTDLNGNGIITYDEVGKKTSETYYETRLGKGDEIADRSFNFTADGSTIKTESIFEYGTANL
ncbi:MAG: hypothetical protein WC522_09460, partial [Candidatus Omnitrophota bacterium]